MNTNKKQVAVFIAVISLTLVGVGIAIFNNFRTEDSDLQDDSQISVPRTDDFNVTQDVVKILEKGYIDIKNFNELSPDSDPLVKQQAKSALFPIATNLNPEKES